MIKTLILIPLLSTLAACGGAPEVTPTSGLTQAAATASDSQFAYKYGEATKQTVLSSIKKLQGITIVDARDPRLYNPGEVIQPPVPADLAVVKILDNGGFRTIAFILDRPGYFELKGVNWRRGPRPTIHKLYWMSYGVERASFSHTLKGQLASIMRNTSGRGWNYFFYVLVRPGHGINTKNFSMFDNRVQNSFVRSLLEDLKTF